MRIVAQTSKLIVQCIDQFWLDFTFMSKEKLQSKLKLDAEQMIMLCMYIILKA